MRTALHFTHDKTIVALFLYIQRGYNTEKYTSNPRYSGNYNKTSFIVVKKIEISCESHKNLNT